jgi:hypothetical protein
MGNKHFSGSYISPAIVGTALCKDIVETIPVEHAKTTRKLLGGNKETVAKWSFEKKVYIVLLIINPAYNIGKNAKLTCYD